MVKFTAVHSQHQRPLARLVTNRAFAEAMRKGSGPLTLIERAGLFVISLALVVCGIIFIAASFELAKSIRLPLVLGLPASITCMAGLLCLALGGRTIRHVVWRAKQRD
jgi:hypothetical protein